jgi:hypothetical protein
MVFDPWSGQTKDYKIGICCNSKEQKEAWNPNNVFLSVAICQPTDCFFSELALKYLTW